MGKIGQAAYPTLLPICDYSAANNDKLFGRKKLNFIMLDLDPDSGGIENADPRGSESLTLLKA